MTKKNEDLKNMKPELLTEETHDNVEFLTESSEDNPDQKDYYIRGIFLQADVKNGNGRSYPKRVLQEAVNEYQQHYISGNRGYGELGHPDKPKINLDRVCVLTKEITEEGNNYIGKAKVIDTPFGDIVKTFLNEDVKLGVSSRGMGRVLRGVVQNGFRLKTAIDVVADPSAPDAFVDCIMENQETIWTEKNGMLVEEFVNEMKSTKNKDRLKRTLALKNLFDKISSL